tara:strand:- start:420 stop:1136 length:717 start_codon:yes stop_codon:yes gene_type:complete
VSDQLLDDTCLEGGSNVFRYQSDDEWFYLARLSSDAFQYFLQQVGLAKLRNQSISSELAGCISESLKMQDPSAFAISEIFQPLLRCVKARDVFRRYLDLSIRSNPIKNPDIAIDSEYTVELWSLWANFQSQYQYNPIHNHSGFLSFVIWMKIPYSHEEQAKLDFIRNSNASGTAGNFVFMARDFRKECIIMNPSMEGCFSIFPSSYRHQVFPFYGTESIRLSIAGNFGLKEDLVEDNA